MSDVYVAGVTATFLHMTSVWLVLNRICKNECFKHCRRSLLQWTRGIELITYLFDPYWICIHFSCRDNLCFEPHSLVFLWLLLTSLLLVPKLVTRLSHFHCHIALECLIDKHMAHLHYSFKFGHEMLPLTYLATRWHHLHELQNWPHDGTHTCKKREIAEIYLRKFFWIFRKILGWEREINTAHKPSPEVAPSKMEVAPS